MVNHPNRAKKDLEIQVTLEGGLCGQIWWPVGALCGKTLRHRFSDDERAWGEKGTLREHVLRATNDGDFQNAEVTGDSVLVVSVISRRGNTVKTRTRHFPITLFPSIKDCVNEEAYSGDFSE